MTGIEAQTDEISSAGFDSESTLESTDGPGLVEVLALAAAFASIAVLFTVRDHWPAQFLLFILIATVPGVLLLRLLRRSGPEVGVLAVPASVLVLLVSGLTVNLLGPVLGEDRPLEPEPLLVGFEIICFALLALHSFRLDNSVRFRAPVSPTPWRTAALLLLPMLAAAGALQLNAGRGSELAVGGVVVFAVVLVGVFLLADRLSLSLIATSLFSSALASLWSYSLRSESIFGWDLTSEFLKMSDALNSGTWSFLHREDAYGAMLSVTILPVQLHYFTGMSLPLIVKVLFPAFFAVTPVLVYFFSRQFLRARWAFFAAAVLIAQINFGLQMPQLARQEIGLMLFVGLLVAMVRNGNRRSYDLILVGLLALGVVVSHYSTAYLSIVLLLLGAILLLFLVKARHTSRALVLVAVPLMVLIVGSFCWNVVLTKSTSNVSSVFQSLGTSGLQVLPDRRGGGFLERYLTGTVTPEVPAAQYQATVAEFYAERRPYVVPLPDASLPQYALMDASAPPAPSVLTTVVALFGFGLRNVLFLLSGIGSLIMLLRRRSSTRVRLVGATAFAAVLTLALVRVSGTLADSYNQDRALIHALVLLGPAAAFCLQAGSARLRHWAPRWSSSLVWLVGLALLLQIGVSTSIFSLPLGQGGGANVSSSSEDVARQYVTQGELAGARWLGQHASQDEYLYADRYAALRVLLATGRYDAVFQEIVPQAINRRGWVFASTVNVHDDTARSQTRAEMSSYRYPDRFLSDHFDVVYSNGQSRVYSRLTG